MAPGSLKDDDDDDEMDIGKKGFSANLNYDSDEKTLDSDLISLDRAPKKQAPKLRKPASK
jgi:hypothetical protein